MNMLNRSGKLEGQTAIVTGAARGIGAACAYALAREGARVIIVDLMDAQDAINRILHDFPSAQIGAEKADIRDRESVKRVINGVVEKWGRLDIVVNNAGTCSRLGLENMTDEDWYRDIDTNLRGAFLFTQMAIYPHMKNQGYGKIVNISSISGIIGGLVSSHPGQDSGRSGPAYAASKGGVIALTKWVAKEVGKFGINCNAIAPGAVKTEMTSGLDYPLDSQPIKRMGDPSDIAEAVLYLASSSSNYVTGQVLRVCGGSAIG